MMVCTHVRNATHLKLVLKEIKESESFVTIVTLNA